jgi:hypothetical protein
VDEALRLSPDYELARVLRSEIDARLAAGDAGD